MRYRWVPGDIFGWFHGGLLDDRGVFLGCFRDVSGLFLETFNSCVRAGSVVLQGYSRGCFSCVSGIS